MTIDYLEYQLCELKDKCIRFKENGNCKNTNCQKCAYQIVCNMLRILDGMTVEDHIAQLKKLKSFHNGSYGASINFALDTMEKHQKIEELVTKWSTWNADNHYVRKIREVLEERWNEDEEKRRTDSNN